MKTSTQPFHRFTVPTRSLLAATGLLLAGTAISSSAWAKEHGDKDEHEEEIAWAKVPAAVQATFTREAAGGKIEEIEVERKHGKLSYEAEVRMADGSVREITVAADGTWLKSKAEHDDEDEHEHEEKDHHEKGEHKEHMN